MKKTFIEYAVKFATHSDSGNNQTMLESMIDEFLAEVVKIDEGFGGAAHIECKPVRKNGELIQTSTY